MAGGSKAATRKRRHARVPPPLAPPARGEGPRGGLALRRGPHDGWAPRREGQAALRAWPGGNVPARRKCRRRAGRTRATSRREAVLSQPAARRAARHPRRERLWRGAQGPRPLPPPPHGAVQACSTTWLQSPHRWGHHSGSGRVRRPTPPRRLPVTRRPRPMPRYRRPHPNSWLQGPRRSRAGPARLRDLLPNGGRRQLHRPPPLGRIRGRGPALCRPAENSCGWDRRHAGEPALVGLLGPRRQASGLRRARGRLSRARCARPRPLPGEPPARGLARPGPGAGAPGCRHAGPVTALHRAGHQAPAPRHQGGPRVQTRSCSLI